jgi:hypothetical protein
MEKKLLSEIKRIHSMMGLVTEGPSPKLMGITSDIVNDLINLINPKKRPSSFFKGSEKILYDDIETLSSIASGKIRNVPDIEIEKLITRIIKSNKKIGDYLVPKLINNNVKALNQISKFKESIKAYKNAPHSSSQTTDQVYETISKGIDRNVDGVFSGTPDVIKDYIKNDLKKYTNELFYPNRTQIKNLAGNSWESFKQGWKMGKGAKSGSAYTARYLTNKLTKSKISQFMDDYFDTQLTKKLSPEEIQTVKKFLITGVADTPMLKQAYKTYGFPGASGNFFRQLWKKLWWLMKVKFFANLALDWFKDLRSKGEEISDEELHEFSKVLWRLCRAIEIPSAGWISPAGWFGGLLFTTAGGASGGDLQKGWDRLKTYLMGNDEDAVGKWWDGVPIGEFLSKGVVYLDNLIRGIDKDIDETKKGNTDIPNYIPPQNTNQTTPETEKQPTIDSTKITPVKTEEIKNQLYNYLKTIPSLNKGSNKIGTNDKPYIFDKGNNVWEFQTAGDSIMKFQYNPQTKIFSQIK